MKGTHKQISHVSVPVATVMRSAAEYNNLDQYRRQIAMMSRSLQNNDNTIRQLLTDLTEAEKAFGHKTSENVALNFLNRAASDEIEDLKRFRFEANKTIETLQRNLATANESIHVLKERLAASDK